MEEKIWPVYEFYGVLNITELVECAIASLKGKSVIEQFRYQNIRLIHKGISVCQGILAQCSGGWFSIGIAGPLDVLSVAHELGHTFEALCEGEFFSDWQTHFTRLHFRDCLFSEPFAIAFADRWISEESNYTKAFSFFRENKDRKLISLLPD